MSDPIPPTEPIAVVGLSCRFPQDADSPTAFWDMLCQARSARTKVPTSRWNPDAFYHPDPSRNDALNTQHGHFCSQDPACFDAPFFGMSSEEASAVDPQQRHLLEETYHALENGGISMESIAGTETSVYTASFGRDHDTLLTADPALMSPYHLMGVTGTMLANRISWFYDLKGPSLALDTACSSSLYAIHLACQSLRSGESASSIVGGSNILLSPETMAMPLSRANIMSPDGLSKSFDHRADGYSRGEGVAVIVLKRLGDAIRHGNVIRSVIRSVAVNHDGNTPSVTAPSTAAQEALIRRAYRQAGLDTARTGFVEAHGTGTQVGDPIEANIIGRVFRDRRPPDARVVVGAVKTNIGHLEGASGLAALIKTTYILETGRIPPNLWLEKVNASIDAEVLQVKFPTKIEPWPVPGLRQASINNFGYGGSNAHLILQDTYHCLQELGLQGLHQTISSHSVAARDGCGSADHAHTNSTTNSTTDDEVTKVNLSHRLLFLSAGDDKGPSRQLAALTSYLDIKLSWSSHALDRVAYTLCERRSALPWKSFIVAPVNKPASHELSVSLAPPTRPVQQPVLAFVFSGQGAQWPGMGRELLVYPAFRTSVESSDAILLDELGAKWSPLQALSDPAAISDINNPAIAQPLCTILQIALVDLLRAWMIMPSIVIGHSSGEITAGYAAGALSRSSALKVAYYRGLLSSKLMEQTIEKITMMACSISQNEAVALIEELGLEGDVFIGCMNAPRNTTLTGLETGIDRVKIQLDARQIFARKLSVPVAYHSPFMQTMVEEYRAYIETIDNDQSTNAIESVQGNTNAKVYSSVQGSETPTSELSKSEYWIENLLQPVNFLSGLRGVASSLQSAGRGPSALALVEIGPHATLRRPLHDCLENMGFTGKFSYTSVLRRCQDAVVTGLETAGSLASTGLPMNLLAANGIPYKDAGRLLLTDMPGYPFRPLRFWHESRLFKGYRARQYGRHDLLGTPVADWNEHRPTWRNLITIKEMAWVRDHAFNGAPVYPAGGLVVMAIEAARQIFRGHAAAIAGIRLRNIIYVSPLMVSEDSGADVTIELQPFITGTKNAAPRYHFTIYGWHDVNAVEVCRGSVQVELNAEQGLAGPTEADLARHRTTTRRCVFGVDHDQFYANLQDIGYHFGPAFQLLRKLHYDKQGGAVARCCLNDWMQREAYPEFAACIIHPAVLDAVFHLPIAGFSNGGWKAMPTMVAGATQEIYVSSQLLDKGAVTEMDTSSVMTSRAYREMTCDVAGFHPTTHAPLIRVVSHRAVATGLFGDNHISATHLRELAYTLEYKPCVLLNEPRQLQALFDPNLLGTAWIDQASLDTSELLALQLAETVGIRFVEKPFSGPNAHLAKYVHRLTELASSPQAKELKSRFDSAQIAQLVASAHDSGSPLVKLVRQVGEHLKGILDGSSNALEHIFNGSLAEDYYTLISQAPARAMASYLDALAHENPAMRIVEIGAGTGSTTTHIVRKLSYDTGCGQLVPRFKEYVYTDISAFFFEKARDKFADYSSAMQFRTLDISVLPNMQGFEGGSFDVVIAGEVLHATPSLRSTLRHVRWLLKPGGKVMLGEQVNMARLTDTFIFGALPGWWLGKEVWRKHGALVDTERWSQELEHAGFNGVELEFKDAPGSLHNLSALISTATDEAKGGPTAAVEIVVVVDQNVELQMELADEIFSRLEKLHLETCVKLLDETAEYTTSHDCVVVVLLDVGATFLDPATLTEAQWASFKTVATHASKLLWTALGTRPDHAQAAGIARVVCSERGRAAFSVLTLDDSRPISSAKSADTIQRVLENLVESSDADHESEFLELNGILSIGRAVPDGALNDAIERVIAPTTLVPTNITATHDAAYRLSIGTPGLLETLHFVEDKIRPSPLADDEVDVDMHVSSLNFKDVLVASGMVPGNFLGYDGSGIVRDAGPKTDRKVGEKVLVHAESALATSVRCKGLQTFAVPADVNMEDAAGLAAVLATAHYSLVTIARLRKGERVLIHSGAGGVGQAAIQIAQAVGADVFTTVSNEAKRELLQSRYDIPAGHIFSSRTSAFAAGIRAATGGQGVHVVLNSLAGELFQKSFETLASFGRFVEIGRRDIMTDTQLGMSGFAQNTAFTAVNMGQMLAEAPEMLSAATEESLAFFSKHKLRPPFPTTVYSAADVVKAFNHVSSGKSMGKVVIDMRMDVDVPVMPSTQYASSFTADATYVIAGGLGGLGRSIVRWMRRMGAVNFLLLTRSEFSDSPHVYTFLEDMEAAGANVVVAICDVSDMSTLQKALDEHLPMLPPVRGCIQGSMVLRDALFENMTLSDFLQATLPKTVGTENLAATLPEDMDFFILLSSIAGVVGSRGQANYAAGNVFQDAFARSCATKRRCTSVNLGLMLGVGYAAENATVTKTFRAAGSSGVREEQFLALLGLLCDPKTAPSARQIITGLDTPSGLRARGFKEPLAWMSKPLFRVLGNYRAGSGAAAAAKTDAVDYKALVAAAGSLQEATEVVVTAYMAKLKALLALDEEIDTRRPAFKLGVDSLSAVEIRYWFLRELGVEVAVFDILSEKGIETFCEDAAKKVWKQRDERE